MKPESRRWSRCSQAVQNKGMSPLQPRGRGQDASTQLAAVHELYALVRLAHCEVAAIVVVMKFKVEIEREEDGRWIAEVNELPGVLVYGDSVEQAQAKAQALALRVLADRLENGEATPFESVSFAAA